MIFFYIAEIRPARSIEITILPRKIATLEVQQTQCPTEKRTEKKRWEGRVGNRMFPGNTIRSWLTVLRQCERLLNSLPIHLVKEF